MEKLPQWVSFGRLGKLFQVIDIVEFTARRKDDVTAEMCQAMGVSRGIINNVIFCHQEDNNWPLEADKKVKETTLTTFSVPATTTKSSKNSIRRWKTVMLRRR